MDAEESRSGKQFPSTHWTQVYLASDHGQEAGSRALAELLQAYRPALHQYIKSKYRSVPNEEIEDWVSGFIEEKVLEQHVLRHANKGNGKFRHYVQTVLLRYVVDQCRDNNRLKRRPPGGMVVYEEDHENIAQAGNSEPNPGDLAWARQVIERARNRTEAYFRKKGREKAWTVFLEGCYRPLYQGEPRLPDAELARRHGFGSERKASNTLANAKNRFGIILREVVREYVASDREVDAELQELLAVVSHET